MSQTLRPFITLSCLVPCALVAACVPEFDDDLSRITRPRLLALRSNPAEASERQTVSVEALVAHPDGTPLPATFQLCLDRKPLTELGPVSPRCLALDAPAEVAEPLGSGSQVQARIPQGACRLFGPRRPDPKPGEPAGRPVDPDPTGGFYQPVIAAIDTGEITLGTIRLQCGLSGVTRENLLEYSSRYRPNENPDIAVLEATRDAAPPLVLEGSGATARPGESLELKASWEACPRESVCGDAVCGAAEDVTTCVDDCRVPKGCRGAETYAWFDAVRGAVVDRREAIVISWYASAGSFEFERTGRSETDEARDASVRFTAPTEPGVVRLWTVIRDDRGGTGYRSAELMVVP